MPRLLERAALFLAAFQIVLRFCINAGSGWGANLFVHATLWAAAALWLASRALEGRWTMRLSGVEIPLTALLALSCASIPRASYTRSAIEGAGAFATYALLVPLCASLFAGRRALLLRLLLASLAALSLYAVLQRFWILPEIDRMSGAQQPEEIRTRLRSGEIWATFFYPNSFAGFLVLLVPLAAGAAVDAKGATRAACGAIAALGALCLAFTGSLGAWIAAAGGAVLFAALLSRRRAVLVAVAAAGVVAAVVLVPRVLRHHSMEIRATYWSAAAKIAAERPVLGVGLNNFREHYYLHRDARQYETAQVHNDYLQILVELGALGLLAFLAFLAMTVRASMRADEPPGASDGVGPMAAGVAVAVVGAAALHGVFADVAWGLVVPMVLAAWVVTFAKLHASPGPAARFGLLAGLASFCVHSMVDFNLYDYGAGAALFLAAALLAPGRPVELGRPSAPAAAAACALVALGALAIAPDRTLDADHRAAQGDIDGAIALRPQHAPYHFQAGTVHARSGNHAEAAAAFGRAVQLYPTRAGNHAALARALDRIDRRDDALHHYRHALELERRADIERLRLEPPDKIRALARLGDHDALVALMRAYRRDLLPQIPAQLGDDYDALTKPAIDRAIAAALTD